MIKIGVCDDEIIMCNILSQKVSLKMKKQNEPFEIISYTDAVELLHSHLDFDLIFLDIQMPNLDGIELAKKLREQDIECALIFVTVLKEHMLDAFEVEAIDYLCKPIDDKRLEKALKRALKGIKTNREKHLLIQTMNWRKVVKISTIYYCEVINRKIYLHTRSGVIDYYGKFEEIEKQLDYRFVKCHRSYIVNLDYLKEYANGQIILENGQNIPVSRLRHQEFMEFMLQYMKKRGE